MAKPFATGLPFVGEAGALITRLIRGQERSDEIAMPVAGHDRERIPFRQPGQSAPWSMGAYTTITGQHRRGLPQPYWKCIQSAWQAASCTNAFQPIVFIALNLLGARASTPVGRGPRHGSRSFGQAKFWHRLQQLSSPDKAEHRQNTGRNAGRTAFLMRPVAGHRADPAARPSN
jgi:hypothetical protein